MEVVELLQRTRHILLNQILHLLLRSRFVILVSLYRRKRVKVFLLLSNRYQAHTTLKLSPLCALRARLTNPPLLERIAVHPCLNRK